MNLISVVIPIFNEEESLPELFKRLDKVVGENSKNLDFEIVFVDDGSTDLSETMLVAWCESRSDRRYVRFSRNFGHQAALLAGMTVSRGDAVIAMDGDLQDPPELIPQLVERWEDGADVVYAQRNERLGDGRFKKFSAHLFYALIDRVSDTALPRNVGDFRLMDRRVVDLVVSLPERSLYLRGLVSWFGFKQVAVEFSRDPRFAGRTKYSIRRMLNLASDGITSFSDKPLRLVTRLGLVVMTGSFFSLIALFVSLALHGATLQKGWMSLIVAIMLLGGVQLICIGIVGEYVSKIYRESKGRPHFVIDEKRSLM